MLCTNCICSREYVPCSVGAALWRWGEVAVPVSPVFVFPSAHLTPGGCCHVGRLRVGPQQAEREDSYCAWQDWEVGQGTGDSHKRECRFRCHCICPHGVDVNGLSFQSLPLLVVPVGAPSLPGRSSGSAAAARVFDGPTEVDVKTVSSVARAASRLHAKGVFACVECGTAQGVPPRFYGKRRFAAVAAHLQKLPQYPPARSSAVEGLLSRCRMVLLDGKAGRSTALVCRAFFSIAALHGLW